MAHLIKLESGQYLNLDQIVHTADYDGFKPSAYALLVGGTTIELSDKDLEKIDQIAAKSTYEYMEPYYMADGEDLTLVTAEEARKAGLI